MKITTFNVNGINGRLPSLLRRKLDKTTSIIKSMRPSEVEDDAGAGDGRFG